jgi:hypothetical protein
MSNLFSCLDLSWLLSSSSSLSFSSDVLSCHVFPLSLFYVFLMTFLSYLLSCLALPSLALSCFFRLALPSLALLLIMSCFLPSDTHCNRHNELLTDFPFNQTKLLRIINSRSFILKYWMLMIDYFLILFSFFHILGQLPYRGLTQTMTTIAGKEGIKGLFQGFSPYYLRCGGQTLLMFLSVEWLRKTYQSIK